MDFVAFLSELYGKGEETARRLRSAGLTTPESFTHLTPEGLSTITRLSVSSSKGIILTAAQMRQDVEHTKSTLVEIEGIGDRRAKKLQEAGLRTVKAVALAEEERIAKILKVPQSAARTMVKSAQRIEGSQAVSGMTAPETEALTTPVLLKEKHAKEKSKTSSELAESFWQFG